MHKILKITHKTLQIDQIKNFSDTLLIVQRLRGDTAFYIQPSLPSASKLLLGCPYYQTHTSHNFITIQGNKDDDKLERKEKKNFESHNCHFHPPPPTRKTY